MSSQREERVRVDIPIRFTYEDEQNNRKVTSQGRIDDISLNGMRVELPLSAEIIERDHIDFDLDLPNPFMKIKGQGKIQWKRWDAEKNCTTCGLKLEPMTLSQLSDLDEILNEVITDSHAEKV